MKSKKVLTILLALAIMVTFMPTMAFATTSTQHSYWDSEAGEYVPYDAVWSDNFDKVTINGVEFNTVRSLDGDLDSWDGEMRATIDLTNRSSEYQKYDGISVNYYDMDFASTGIAAYEFPSEVPQKDFEQYFVKESDEDGCYYWRTPYTVFFRIPDYIEGYSQLTKEQKNKKYSGSDEFVNTWFVEFSSISDYQSGATTDQSFTVKSTLNTFTSNAPNLKGTIADKTVKVTKNTITPRTAKFYFDSTSNTSSYEGEYVTTYYDGETHTVVADEVPGWTVSYAVFNSSTSKYDDVAAVTLKDVRVDKDGYSDPLRVKVTFKQTGRKDVYRYLSVNLESAGVRYGFDEEASVTDPTPLMGSKSESYTYHDELTDRDVTVTTTVPYVVSQKNITFEAKAGYKAMDFVVVKPFEFEASGIAESKWDDQEKKWVKATNAAFAKAVEANKAELLSYLADFYEVKETASKADPNTITLKLIEKDLTTAQVKELNKKYAQLVANFEVYDKYADKATLKVVKDVEPVVVNDKDDDINFSGVTKYVYSGKKAIKKGKLKKNQTIAVKAVADSGNEVTFSATTADKKITVNSTTGKITVKKGLKKGTYKVEVTAKTAAGNGYKAAKATATYTIVVKKK